MGNKLILSLFWNPTPDQTINLIGRSKHNQLRALLVDSNIVMWDARYVEHRDVVDMLDLKKSDYSRREKSLFVGLRDDKKPYITNRSVDHPRVSKFIDAGFMAGSI